ncbi:hypothetical protein EYF80_044768 [Liparis tanakae]|uniref:Uncharacterized protein n=1 Tax=Liparis tanakae TaxID=230148 RepID=A0A4Z2FVH9_9TELE|nr:hypothetical protein EYF80_044768 [Liparis tanakae]
MRSRLQRYGKRHPQLLVSGGMGLLSLLALVLLWAAVQAAGHRGCCTTFSKVHAVRSIVKRGGAVQCRWQGITEGCSINAV